MIALILRNSLFYLDNKSRAFYWQVSTDIKRKSNLKYAHANLFIFLEKKDVGY